MQFYVGLGNVVQIASLHLFWFISDSVDVSCMKKSYKADDAPPAGVSRVRALGGRRSRSPEHGAPKLGRQPKREQRKESLSPQLVVDAIFLGEAEAQVEGLSGAGVHRYCR